jgi:hypothetical protein
MNYILLSAVLLLAAPPAACAAAPEEAWRRLAVDFAGQAAGRKVRSVAVLLFSREASASEAESRYVYEKFLTCLAGTGKVSLYERAQLGKLIQERRLAEAGLTTGRAPGRPRAGEAVIAGVVFGTAEKLRVILRLIEPVTGEVLYAGEAETGRLWDLAGGYRGFDFEMPDLSGLENLFLEVEEQGGAYGLRDALNSGEDGCPARRRELAARQRGAINAKAKYWALRIKEPDFDRAGLRRNPGSEIEDPEAKSAFYLALEKYLELPETPALRSAEVASIVDLSAAEEALRDDCGGS